MLNNKSGFLISYFASSLAVGITFGITVVLVQKLGLSLNEISFIFTFFGISILIFEVPTGIFGDLYGRKISVILGLLLSSLAYFIIVVSSEVWQFIVANIIAGVGVTFVSGSFTSWYIEYCKNNNELIDEQFYAQLDKYSYLAMFIGGISGAALADIYFKLPWYFSSILYLLSAVALLQIEESSQSTSGLQGDIPIIFRKRLNAKYFDTFKKSISVLKQNKQLQLLIIADLLQVAVLTIFSIVNQPFFQMKSLDAPLMFLGAVTSLRLLVSFIVAHYMINIKRIIETTNSLLLFSFLGNCVIFLSLTMFDSIIIIALLFIFRGVTIAIFRSSLSKSKNELIPDEYRATILSFASLFTSVAESASYFVLSLSILKIESIYYEIFYLLALFMILASILTLYIKHKQG